jgi:tetratricopeptide (TPR) repeat protein
MKQLTYVKWFIVLFFFYGNNMFAQNLEYEEQTKDDDICTYDNVHACITVIADKSLNLGFNSNLEMPEQIASTMNKVVVGELIHYTLHFKTGKEQNKDYRDRILEISSSKYPQDPLKIHLDNLQPKESLTFFVTLKKCYEPLFSEGNTLFFAGKYKEAGEKYAQAKECLDKKDAALVEGEVEKKIVRVDSIIAWIEKASESMLLLDYNMAIKYYNKVLLENPSDHPTIVKIDAAMQKQLAYCDKCEKAAYRYYREHEYDKALELYQRIANQICNNNANNQAKVDTIKIIIDSQKNKYRVFTYEFGVSKFRSPNLSLPISFSTGKYLNYKMGGYFSFATNPAFFNMLRSDYTNAVQGSAGISFGMNLRPVKPRVTKYVPLWLFWGTGYTFMGAYHYKNASDEDVRFEGGKLPDAKLNLRAYHAVPFEAGLLLKVKWLVLRYTFQYRFAIKIDTQEYINPYMHSLGIGICY